MSTREAIVAAATDLVDRERAVMLRAVSRQAGLPTSSIYQHFPNSTAILLAVCHTAFAEPAFRLFTGHTTNALTLWLGLHGLADQRATVRSSSQLTAVAPRLFTSLI